MFPYFPFLQFCCSGDILTHYVFFPFELWDFVILLHSIHDYFTFPALKSRHTFLKLFENNIPILSPFKTLFPSYSGKIRPSEYFFLLYSPFPTTMCCNFQNIFPLPFCPIPNLFLGFADKHLENFILVYY